MSNLTNEQKARLMGRYIGRTVKNVNYSGILLGIQRNFIMFSQDDCGHHWFNQDSNTFLLLKPLSQISDEDAIFIGRLIELPEVSRHDTLECLAWKGRAFIGHYFSQFSVWDGSDCDTAHSRIIITNVLPTVAMQIYQFVLKQGYDLPVFIEPNHPDNGKTMKELGLAIYE